jgi:hypothetical protein
LLNEQRNKSSDWSNSLEEIEAAFIFTAEFKEKNSSHAFS